MECESTPDSLRQTPAHCPNRRFTAGGGSAARRIGHPWHLQACRSRKHFRSGRALGSGGSRRSEAAAIGIESIPPLGTVWDGVVGFLRRILGLVRVDQELLAGRALVVGRDVLEIERLG